MRTTSISTNRSVEDDDLQDYLENTMGVRSCQLHTTFATPHAQQASSDDNQEAMLAFARTSISHPGIDVLLQGAIHGH